MGGGPIANSGTIAALVTGAQLELVNDTVTNFTTKALIHPLTCQGGGNICMGGAVVIDRTKAESVTVALIGLHVVGVVEDHPEFVWATFEHEDNAPDRLDVERGALASAYTFYRPGCAPARRSDWRPRRPRR